MMLHTALRSHTGRSQGEHFSALATWQELPHATPLDAAILRLATFWARRRLLAIDGLDRILPSQDPFILALNHSTRLEAIAVPTLLMYLRGGKHIHFLADWNFKLIPGIGFLYRRARVITVLRKPAKPRFLNALKPLFTDGTSAMDQARQHLREGRPLGLFPEGTVNRAPQQLLRGRAGMARLSLETGVPVVPAGLRFPGVPAGHPIPDGAPFELRFGTPLTPRRCLQADLAESRAWHAQIMQAIAELSDKRWNFAKGEMR